MPKNIVAGVSLAAVGAVLMLVASALDLEVESVVLVGIAIGAVVALIPDRTPLARLAGVAGGFVAVWIGYVARAAVLPDSSSGRAVAVAVVVLLCVAVTAASLGRLPLWAPLLGVAPMAGAYEATFSAAPPEVVATSVTAATSLLLTMAVGFVVASLVAPTADGADHRAARRTRKVKPKGDDTDTTSLETMMEKK